MKAHSIDRALREATAPAPDPVARLKAKRAALEEFARARALQPEQAEREADIATSAPNESAAEGSAPDMSWLPPPDQRYGTRSFRRSMLSNVLATGAAACMTVLILYPMFPGLSMMSEGSHQALAFALLETKPLSEERIEMVTVPLPSPDFAIEIYPPKLEMPAPSSVSMLAPRAMIATDMPGPADELVGRDEFPHFSTNPVKRVADEPVSTFSIDVDTTSYSFVRRQLAAGVPPQKDAVRAEEMINYFDYSWPAPQTRDPPFSATIAVGDSPWGAGKKLVHVGIKGYDIAREQEPDANLVFLLDVSGSMTPPDKLPLVKQSMALLVSRLKPTDTVAIVVYAGEAGLVLAPTQARQRGRILDALDALQPGGSTAGAEGIRLAYELAEQHFRKGGVNRILLATDGDFNVGITDVDELQSYVEREREKGIFLSVLGFGQGNYRDEMAQALAQNGNGVAAYIDTLSEARKVLVQQATGSLFTIAKDVKLQVEFNPATVAEYRLVGYETRTLTREDFNNDAVDAGDIGAGHTVTAIYEITPAGSAATLIDESRYAPAQAPAQPRGSTDEYGYLRIRYKLADGDKSRLIERPILVNSPALPASLQGDVDFATAVAGFAQLLRGGLHTGSLTYEDIIRQAQSAKGEDPHGHRAEFVELVRQAQKAKGM